jgi:exosortase
VTAASLPRTAEAAQVTRRSAGFAALLAAGAVFYWSPLTELVKLALSDDTYSHILLVPMLSAGLVWMNRRAVFARAGSSIAAAAACFLTGALLCALRNRLDLLPSGGKLLTISMLSAVLMAWSAFLLCFGARAFRTALFPMLFLLLAVPLPAAWIDRLILWLQQGSSDVTYWLFRATGTPVFRRGFIFTVPGQTIEVAQECSGIRSSLALLITCLLAGYLFLRTGWARLVLLVAAVPMLIIKNGIRIVTLTLLSIHVDPGFLRGRLHHQGGFVFFVLGLVILWPLLRWLQRVEARGHAPGDAASPHATPAASRAG